ncbi:MAG TPA: LysR family transcriptional regulator [Burkholderiaceae bacterium]|nr:LysR family transcriptional regulator [Burkholderiaceae bacterium]
MHARTENSGPGKKLDRLHLLAVFVAVVDAGSLAGAARKLGISPSAVTRAVNDLEGHLRVRLLTRTTRVVRVTEAGARYAEDCRRVLTELADADAAVSGMHGTPRGTLSLTAPALFGARFVTPVVTEYLQCYPEISASCWFVDRIVNMTEEGIDVAVRIGDLDDSSLQATRVGRVRRIVCAAPAYLERFGTPRAPEDLVHHHIVSSATVTPPREWRFNEGDMPRVMKLQPRLVTTTNDSAVNAAISGFGLVRLLSYQVADALRDGRLVTVLDAFEGAASPVHLLHREGRHAAKKVRAFLDLAIERLRANPELQH